jgi:hypothetical protein
MEIIWALCRVTDFPIWIDIPNLLLEEQKTWPKTQNIL